MALVPVAAPESRRILSLGRPAVAGPTVTTAGVIVGTVAGEVLCVDPATGSIRWTMRLAGPIESPPTIRDGRLIVVGGRGDVHFYR
jgi:outer membrane protein assembly factor BamB